MFYVFQPTKNIHGNTINTLWVENYAFTEENKKHVSAFTTAPPMFHRQFPIRETTNCE